MQSLTKATITKGTRVLLRADFNVPMKGKKIEDTFRIDKTMPTINYLLKKKAIVIILAHLGDDGSATLEPVAKYLGGKVQTVFTTAKDVAGIAKVIETLTPGTVLVVENIRRFEEEKTNDKVFAKSLASLGDIYINDAFSVSHRAHASLVGITKYLPSYAGYQLQKEVEQLSRVFQPKHPFLFILGGAKFETKMPLIKKFLKTADSLFIAGALANELFEEKGLEVGTSVVDPKDFHLTWLTKNKKVLLPLDLVVVSKKGKRTTTPDSIEKDEAMLDIGKESLAMIKEKINAAKFILWNGPVGKLPQGTKKILEMIAATKAVSIIGGGDTVDLVSRYKMEKDFTFVSTGGGATLDFLSTGTLPAIKALK
jgi:3-phosphoglycerate kinase